MRMLPSFEKNQIHSQPHFLPIFTYSTNTIICPLTTCIETTAITYSHDLLVAKTDGDFCCLVVPLVCCSFAELLEAQLTLHFSTSPYLKSLRGFFSLSLPLNVDVSDILIPFIISFIYSNAKCHYTCNKKVVGVGIQQ